MNPSNKGAVSSLRLMKRYDRQGGDQICRIALRDRAAALTEMLILARNISQLVDHSRRSATPD